MPGFYHDLPKAELHLHLEGSAPPETLGLDGYRFADFDGFLEVFGQVVKALRTPEDYARVTRRLLADLEKQNVRYAEIILSAGVVLWKQQEFAPVFDAVRVAAEGSKVEVRWILDAVRHFGVDHCMKVAELAAERVHQGVVAFGIGGNEERGPAPWFTDVFRFAREAGLHLTAHAGEACGPESVWGALELGAERIGHGIAAIQDPALLRHLRDHDIPLEISITSNVVTGVVPRMEDHPVRRLYDAGVPIVLNTDDPAMFGTTLTAEYELAARQFGFTEEEMRKVAENAFRYAFAWTGQ